ncbi:hypothetical protein MPER_08846 [Moniliophthora perniciosa FA553]|nr:hypothetical protein MPER_08846 [Moniliophthora perniciosa FA553]
MSLVQGQAYTITNMASNTVIDLSGADNKTIQGWQNNGGYSNQKWIALMAGDGWTFKNGRTGVYLSLSDYCGGSSNRVIGSNIPVVWTLTATDASQKIFNVKLPLSSKPYSLDLEGSNAQDGTPIIMYQPTNN